MTAKVSGTVLKKSNNNNSEEKAPVSRVTSVYIEDENSNKEHKCFKRANTNVGVMNKFILQFTRVNEAYSMIEDAFLTIVGTQSQRSLNAKMRLKCKVSQIRPILKYIGLDCFTNEELQNIFNKNMAHINEEITFQRILIGIGVCYFETQKKSKSSLENSTTELELDSEGNVKHPFSVEWTADVIVPNDNDLEESIIDDDDCKISDEKKRFAVIRSGFKVVKSMFDTIDANGNGEISANEFELAFKAICKDPIILKARMEELDYNSDDQISLKEFVFGIAAWVGFNDDMDADENDYDLDQ